jgi:hypothetical protein
VYDFFRATCLNPIPSTGGCCEGQRQTRGILAQCHYRCHSIPAPPPLSRTTTLPSCTDSLPSLSCTDWDRVTSPVAPFNPLPHALSTPPPPHPRCSQELAGIPRRRGRCPPWYAAAGPTCPTLTSFILSTPLHALLNVPRDGSFRLLPLLHASAPASLPLLASPSLSVVCVCVCVPVPCLSLCLFLPSLLSVTISLPHRRNKAHFRPNTPPSPQHSSHHPLLSRTMVNQHMQMLKLLVEAVFDHKVKITPQLQVCGNSRACVRVCVCVCVCVCD